MSWTQSTVTPFGLSGGGDQKPAGSGYIVDYEDDNSEYYTTPHHPPKGVHLNKEEDNYLSSGSPAVGLNVNDLLVENNNSGSGLPSDGDHDDLFVFGYMCKIFRDDEKATFIDEQKHLIPWMGNGELLIDRYDCRGALMDVYKYEPGASSRHIGGDEQSNDNNETYLKDYVTEEELDEERYRDLNEDDDYDDGAYNRDFKRLQSAMDGMVSESETETKYSQSRQYASLGYDYNEKNHDVCIGPEPKPLHDEDAPFVKPVGLHVPEEIVLPTTMKVHAIIEKTAKFISGQGSQMEIILKTKQAANPLFDFLNHGGKLNPYYKFLVNAIRDGKYRPEQIDDAGSVSRLSALAEYGSEDDSEPAYLHPSLFRTANSFPSVSSRIEPLANSYPAVVSSSTASKHNSYSMLVSKIKGTDSPDPLIQQSAKIADHVLSKNSLSTVPTTLAVEQQQSVPLSRPKNQLPSTQDQLIIEKMASYVIKNGTNFETVAKNKGDPRFSFLQTSHQYHWYYLNCKERFKAECNAVVASSDFVTYTGANSISSNAQSANIATTGKSNLAVSNVKKSSVVAELAELKKKNIGLSSQVKKLVTLNKEKGTGSSGSSSNVSANAGILTEEVFSQATLVNKDKDKPVIRFSSALSLNTPAVLLKVDNSQSLSSSTFNSDPSSTIVQNNITKAPASLLETSKDVSEKKDSLITKSSPKKPESPSDRNEKEEGELDEESTSDICLLDDEDRTGNASPASEDENEKMRRRSERKIKAALFLQKLKMAKKSDYSSHKDPLLLSEKNSSKEDITKVVVTGPSLGDLLNRRLQEADIASKSKQVPVSSTTAEIVELSGDDESNEGEKSSSSLSSRKSTDRNSRRRSYKDRRSSPSSSSRSRKRRKRSQSYSSTPSNSSSESNNNSDYGSYSKKKSSKRKHKKRKKKHEKSRSSHKSSRR